MIGFMHDGYFYCANVHRYRHSGTVEYQVTILTNKTRPDIPSRLVLAEKEAGSLALVSEVKVSPAFLQTVLAEIGKHNSRSN